MFCSGLHPVLSCWELSGCISPPVIPPCISASRCFVGLFVFSGEIPCLHLTASAKAPRAALRDPDPLGCAGGSGTGCQWDAPGQGPGTAFGDCSPQEGLPDWRTSMPFGAECFSRCLWVKPSLWSALAPPCRGLSGINNQLLFPCCWNFLFWISSFLAGVWGLQELYHLLLSWALTRFQSCLAPIPAAARTRNPVGFGEGGLCHSSC